MQRLRPLLPPLVLCAALAACSSGGSSGQAAGAAADSSPASSSDAPSVAPSSSAPTTSAAVTSAAAASATAAPVAAASATAAPAAASGSVITFTGFVSGRMTATDCEGGIAQLAVDIDGQPTSFAGIIDAHDFTFVGPKSTGYTLDHGAADPKVTNGGRTFTVHVNKLVRITGTSSDGHPDATVTATGSVTCP